MEPRASSSSRRPTSSSRRCAPPCSCWARSSPATAGPRLAARRLRHRRAPDRPAPQGPRGAGRPIELEHGYVKARARRLRGATIVFDMPTVTGTENLMMAAALAKGIPPSRTPPASPRSKSSRACSTRWAPGSAARARRHHHRRGRRAAAVDHAIIPDRIEAGTLLVAAAVTRGDVLVPSACPSTWTPSSPSSARRAPR